MVITIFAWLVPPAVLPIFRGSFVDQHILYNWIFHHYMSIFYLEWIGFDFSPQTDREALWNRINFKMSRQRRNGGKLIVSFSCVLLVLLVGRLKSAATLCQDFIWKRCLRNPKNQFSACNKFWHSWYIVANCHLHWAY